MKPQNKAPAAGGFGIHDVLYIIFKHKWKIMLLSLIGFGVAGAMILRVLREPSYESMAQLMVRYVVERAGIDPEAGEGRLTGGMHAETAILMSFDTAIEVATAVGPEKFSPDAATPPTEIEVAGKILGGLSVDVPKGIARGSSTNLITISYRNNDSNLTSKVLTELIQVYFRKHLDFHRSTQAFTQVSKQTDEARSKLRQTEEEINQLKQRSAVLTIDATMGEFESRRSSIRQSQLEAQSRLAEQTAKVAAMQKAPPKAAALKDDPADLNAIGEAALGIQVATPEETEAKRTRALALNEYTTLAQRLELLQDRRNKLLIDRKPSDPMIASLDRQISQVQSKGLDLLELYPELAGKAGGNNNRNGQMMAATLSLEEEIALESAYNARLDSVIAQAKALDGEVTKISALGFQLQDLERRRSLEEDKYRYFQSSLEKARLDETLDPSKIPNIAIVQNPTPPNKSIDQKSLKMIVGIAFSGLAAGLALAFLIEMVIDRRVSRPVEIQTRLQLPLMLSIPYIRSKDGIAKLVGGYPALETRGEGGEIILPPISTKNGIAKLDRAGEHFITPYVAAIHDRIIFNFEINNITHKPKLVALTGLSEGAGTSTIAAGLAKAFSETGDRKVLLVNMNTSAGGPLEHPASSLLAALEESRSERFRSTPRHLYLANASTRRDSKNSNALAPADLHRLMPQLVASDFDYIVFDMPPIGPTSPTLTMAGFMDKVLLVLDGENTIKERLSWAYSELENARADVSCIFNKAKSHAPRWVAGGI